MSKICPECGQEALPYDEQHTKFACQSCGYVFKDVHLEARIEKSVEKIQDVLATNELRGVREDLCEVIAILRGDDE